MSLEATRSRVAIIGGGPSGLMTAYLLENRFRSPVEITLFEASNRLGGKILTRQFEHCGSSYEAGAAELYDYSGIGPDPLKELVGELGLTTHLLSGRSVFLGGQLLKTENDLGVLAGSEALAIYQAFARNARSLISPQDYYESDWREDNGDPLARQTLGSLLRDIKNETVRSYIEVTIHSDVATEPRYTSAMYGLQNFLMNEPGYMTLYGINGGMERLPQELARRVRAKMLLDCRVHRVEATPDGTYQLDWRGPTRGVPSKFDFVVVALPNYLIPSIEWLGPGLAQAMREHHDHYDHPAHYLRVSLLFREPFWRDVVTESYFMLDAFGGCCVYDETARNTQRGAGVLGWLIAGEPALYLNNLADGDLIVRVLDSLPEPLAQGRDMYLEGRVHRWTGSVNALPGGFPLREPNARHVPDPKGNPFLFVVGDYLFDSTLNGALDSAECVAEWIAEETGEEATAVFAENTDASQGKSLPQTDHP